MRDETYAFATIGQLSPQIRRGALSPVQVVELFLDRIERHDKDLNSFITVTPEVARRQAREAEHEIRDGRYRGPLHGIPYGVKDTCATRDVPTTWGSALFANQVPDRDATVVRRLREAGAVLLGKLATGEFSSGSRHLGGQVHNPWKLEHTSSGSSAGPGAATAAGLVTFSIAAETSGSIMGPASANGVTGLVPTYGRVSRYGTMAMSWSLDKLGPMCRSAEDAAMVLEAIAGGDPDDPTSRDVPFHCDEIAGDVGKPRVGVVRSEFSGAKEAGTKAVFDSALHVLRDLGAEFEDVTLKEFPYRAALQLIMHVEWAAAFEGLVRERFDELAVGGLRGARWAAALSMSAADYLRAQRIRTEIIQYSRSLFDHLDALVAPTDTSPAPLIAVRPQRRRPSTAKPAANLSYLCNLSGIPFLSTRCGFHEGLPLGLRLVGPHFGEATILKLARAYERATDWYERRPQFTRSEASSSPSSQGISSQPSDTTKHRMRRSSMATGTGRIG